MSRLLEGLDDGVGGSWYGKGGGWSSEWPKYDGWTSDDGSECQNTMRDEVKDPMEVLHGEPGH